MEYYVLDTINQGVFMKIIASIDLMTNSNIVL